LIIERAPGRPLYTPTRARCALSAVALALPSPDAGSISAGFADVSRGSTASLRRRRGVVARLLAVGERQAERGKTKKKKKKKRKKKIKEKKKNSPDPRNDRIS